MLIECPYCESKVDASKVSDLDSMSVIEGVPDLVSLLKCPSCEQAIISYQLIEHQGYRDGQEVWDFGKAIRVWPEPEKSLHHAIPDLVKISLQEAEKCYRAQAYYACAVMCGRALESICADHKVTNKSFAGGLKELLDKGVIDKRLFQWSEALRKHRNIAAHASKEKISREDAKDLVDFARAISDYIYVLTSKFEDFMSRAKKEE